MVHSITEGEASYTIFIDGANTDARNNSTGALEFSNTASDVTIQSAIDALTTGGTIFFKEGTYLITATMTIGDDIRLTGEGWGSIIKLDDDVDDRLLKNATRSGAGNKNIMIDHLHFDGNKDEQVNIGTTDQYSIGNAGMLDFDICENVTITNNFLFNAWATAVELMFVKYFVVSNNQIELSGDDGVGVNNQSSFGTVANNIIRDAGAGVKTHGSPNAIEIQDGAHDVTISGNVCDNALSDGIAVNVHATFTPPVDILIQGNTSNNNAGNGIVLSGADNAVVERIAIVGNECKGNAEYAFRLTGNATAGIMRHILIQGNLFSNSTFGGLNLLRASDCVVQGNVVVSNLLVGLGVDCDGIIVDANYVALNGQFGILLNDDTSNCICSNNVCFDNGAALAGSRVGIAMQGDELFVHGNLCYDSGGGDQQYGIFVYTTNSGSWIQDNVCYGNAVGQIVLNGAANPKLNNNIGFVSEINVLSAGFAIDGVALITVTTAHGLSHTPNIQDIQVTISKDTAVDDWGYDLVKVESVDATNVVVKINVNNASATGSATAKLNIRCNNRDW